MAAVILRLIEQQQAPSLDLKQMPYNDHKPREDNAKTLYAQLLSTHDPKHETWGSPTWLAKLPDFEWPKRFRDRLTELAKAE